MPDVAYADIRIQSTFNTPLPSVPSAAAGRMDDDLDGYVMVCVTTCVPSIQ